MVSDYISLIKTLEMKHCLYCVLDAREHEISFLVPDDADAMIKNEMKGWQRLYAKDTYLYSLRPVLHYKRRNYEVYYHFKLSCRSTLNGAWVPLDRYINNSALKNVVTDENTGFKVLAADDAVCYLLADCIYTKKFFPYEKRKEILKKFEEADRNSLNEKLPKVFFKFSNRLLNMVEQEMFDEIIPAHFAFAEY